MNKESLRIGYVPYSADLTHPDDRRRFPFYASQKGIRYSIADFNEEYDIVILPAPANLTGWWSYKSKHPETVFVFEMVDSLIHQKDLMNLLIKGWGRFFLGKESRPSFVHRNILIRWLKNADIVLCSNPVTVKEVSRWNKNVLFSLDYQEHEYPFLKRDYSINGKMKLFWEGQGLVLPQLLFYKNVFKRVRDFCELHIVTSETFPLYDPFYKVRTENFLKKFPIEAYYHKWNQKNNAALFSKFDCGIIPLDPRDKYKWHKPANKLIAFWFSGIPTLTSDTPAYREIGEKTTDDFLCKSEDEWVQKLESIYKMSADDRKHIAERNYAFVSKVFSNEEMDDLWNKIIEKAVKMFKRRSFG